MYRRPEGIDVGGGEVVEERRRAAGVEGFEVDRLGGRGSGRRRCYREVGNGVRLLRLADHRGRLRGYEFPPCARRVAFEALG